MERGVSNGNHNAGHGQPHGDKRECGGAQLERDARTTEGDADLSNRGTDDGNVTPLNANVATIEWFVDSINSKAHWATGMEHRPIVKRRSSFKRSRRLIRRRVWSEKRPVFVADALDARIGRGTITSAHSASARSGSCAAAFDWVRLGATERPFERTRQ
jgi:hypothetical protein